MPGSSRSFTIALTLQGGECTIYASEGSLNPRFIWQKQDLHPKAWASPVPYTTQHRTQTGLQMDLEKPRYDFKRVVTKTKLDNA